MTGTPRDKKNCLLGIQSVALRTAAPRLARRARPIRGGCLCRIRRGLAVMCGARAPRGGVTRQGVALTDQSDFLLINKTPLSLSPQAYLAPHSLSALPFSLSRRRRTERERARTRKHFACSLCLPWVVVQMEFDSCKGEASDKGLLTPSIN